jgi:hypothetical protein
MQHRNGFLTGNIGRLSSRSKMYTTVLGACSFASARPWEAFELPTNRDKKHVPQ